MARKTHKRILRLYESWLRDVRKMAPSSIPFTIRRTVDFLAYAEHLGKHVDELEAEDVRNFIQRITEAAPKSGWKVRYPLRSFYDFLTQSGELTDSPLLDLEFVEPQESIGLAAEVVRDRLAELSASHQLIALFVGELRASGAELEEIFDIQEDTPVPKQVRVAGRRYGQRWIALSANARTALNEWGGRVPIGARAFQRALEKKDLSPKNLGETSRPGPVSKQLARMPPKLLRDRLQLMAAETRIDQPDPRHWPVIDEFKNWLQQKGLTDRTIDLYARHIASLAAFAESLGAEVKGLNRAEIEAFIAARKTYATSTQAQLRSPVRHFYTFVSERYGRTDDPTDGIEFPKPPPIERRPRRLIAQRLARLSPRNRQIALFVSELREGGASVGEIFEVEERVPVPLRIRLQSGRAGARTVPLSDEARKLLNEWGGRLPIQIRAFQRVLEKVGLSPKDLGDPAHPGLADLHATLLPEETLHRQLEEKTRPAFLRGEYDTAVLVAMKAVEVAVRDASGLSPDDIGVALIREAFNINRGPLRDPQLLRAEREATSNLFAGAIGLFKNPSSHRDIDLSDAIEAAGVIRLADVLLRIVDRAKG